MTTDEILDGILEREGWPAVTNAPSDRGGLTKGGVTFDEYNRWLKRKGKAPILPTDFPNLPKEDARAFMLDDIAGPFRTVEAIDSRLFASMFDWAETSGPDDPTRALQEVLRTCGAAIKADGAYGPKTEAALVACAAKGDLPRLLSAIGKARVLFYVDVAVSGHEVEAFRQANPNTDLENLIGWTSRALEFV